MSDCAIIFDLDGTLLDTIDDLADSANAMLRVLAAPTHSTADYKRMIGDGIEELVRRALPPEKRSQQDVNHGVAVMRQDYRTRWRKKTKAYGGVVDSLRALAQRKMPMAILSNKPDDFTRQMTEALLPHELFAIVRGALPGIPNKPDPTATRQILAALNARAADSYFVGDSGSDIETAINAGMQPIGVRWGFRDEEELLSAGARVVLEHPSELAGLGQSV